MLSLANLFRKNPKKRNDNDVYQAERCASTPKILRFDYVVCQFSRILSSSWLLGSQPPIQKHERKFFFGKKQTFLPLSSWYRIEGSLYSNFEISFHLHLLRAANKKKKILFTQRSHGDKMPFQIGKTRASPHFGPRLLQPASFSAMKRPPWKPKPIPMSAISANGSPVNDLPQAGDEVRLRSPLFLTENPIENQTHSHIDLAIPDLS